MVDRRITLASICGKGARAFSIFNDLAFERLLEFIPSFTNVPCYRTINSHMNNIFLDVVDMRKVSIKAMILRASSFHLDGWTGPSVDCDGVPVCAYSCDE